jgi:hypothetical protein
VKRARAVPTSTVADHPRGPDRQLDIKLSRAVTYSRLRLVLSAHHAGLDAQAGSQCDSTCRIGPRIAALAGGLEAAVWGTSTGHGLTPGRRGGWQVEARRLARVVGDGNDFGNGQSATTSVLRNEWLSVDADEGGGCWPR